MPIKELIYGNRLEDIEVGGASPHVAGYRLHTGPLGTETNETSFCGDSRVLEFYKNDYNNLRKWPQGACESNDWDAWLLTFDEPDDTDGNGADAYSGSQGKESTKSRSTASPTRGSRKK